MRNLELNDRQGRDPKRWLDYHLFNQLGEELKVLEYIRRDIRFKPLLGPEQLALGLTIRFNKANRPYLPPSKNNRELIGKLDDLGFFEVYCTNKAYDGGFGVYLSQVLLFLKYGIDWVRKGFKMPAEEMEIHHVNSNVLDNRIENLHVVTRTLHCFLTNVQIGQHHCYSEYLQVGKPNNNVYKNNGDILVGNSKGTKIGHLIKLTLDRTMVWVKQNLLYSVRKTQLLTGDGSIWDKTILAVGGFLHKLDTYEPLTDSEEQAVMAITANWLLHRAIPDIKTICKNIKGATKAFIKKVMGKEDSESMWKALTA
jgi:hypothetical protein